MTFLTYARTHWEYLLSVALLFASSGGAFWAAIDNRMSLIGPFVFLALIAFICAMWCAEADAWRAIKEDAACRQQRAEGAEG